MFQTKSRQRSIANLSMRLHNGSYPDVIDFEGECGNTVAHWYAQDGKPGLLVAQGTGIPAKESIANQIRSAARLDKLSRGLVSYLGIKASPTRPETLFKPWEDSCLYQEAEFFLARRDSINGRLPAEHRLPEFEVIGPRQFSSEEYAAARSRRAFLIATGRYASHDLVAHAIVQAMTSEESNQTHSERVAADVARAQAVLRETGDTEKANDIMDVMMLQSDNGFSAVIGIGSEWSYAPSRREEGAYSTLMGVDSVKAQELALNDRQHIAVLSGLALGL